MTDSGVDAGSNHLVNDNHLNLSFFPNQLVLFFNASFQGFIRLSSQWSSELSILKVLCRLKRQNLMSVAERRKQLRGVLDRQPDYIVIGKDISLRKEFQTLAADETFCETPSVVIE